MRKSVLVQTAAVVGLLGVALGAFGAHKLKPLLLANGTLSFWETAVLYQFVHLAAFILLALTERASKAAYGCFVGGVILFSGSLYILALTPLKAMVYLTPLGGLLLMVGWFILFFSAGKIKV